VKGAENEFEEVLFYEFESELRSGSLSKMNSAQLAIKSICDADMQAEKIDGKERLRKAQTNLVKILNIMEEPKKILRQMKKPINYSIFKGSRKTLL